MKADSTGRCNTSTAYAASSVLHRPVESATLLGRLGLRLGWLLPIHDQTLVAMVDRLVRAHI
ncbi:protein of unknown function [Burkholderia multivorans]